MKRMRWHPPTERGGVRQRRLRDPRRVCCPGVPARASPARDPARARAGGRAGGRAALARCGALRRVAARCGRWRLLESIEHCARTLRAIGCARGGGRGRHGGDRQLLGRGGHTERVGAGGARRVTAEWATMLHGHTRPFVGCVGVGDAAGRDAAGHRAARCRAARERLCRGGPWLRRLPRGTLERETRQARCGTRRAVGQGAPCGHARCRSTLALQAQGRCGRHRL